MLIPNPAAFRGVFVLPSEAADLHLKLASGDHLKVLLCVFRHADRALSPEEIAEKTGVLITNVADALLFWEEKGLLCDEKTLAAALSPAAPAADEAPKKPEKAVVNEKPTLPSYDMICRRVAESEEVRVLFSEAQGKLGRTIGTADQARLLMLLDYYGLPVEVILTVCEYARSHHSTIAQIYSLGVDFSRREIDTLEAADEEFKRLESVSADWFDFTKLAGIRLPKLTAAQKKYFGVWRRDWGFSHEMLALAFEEMSKHTESMSFPYVNKMLSSWKTLGIDTPEKLAAHEQKLAEELDRRAAARENKKSAYTERALPEKDPNASYDIEAAAEEMRRTVPTLKKKEDRK